MVTAEHVSALVKYCHDQQPSIAVYSDDSDADITLEACTQAALALASNKPLSELWLQLGRHFCMPEEDADTFLHVVSQSLEYCSSLRSLMLEAPPCSIESEGRKTLLSAVLRSRTLEHIEFRDPICRSTLLMLLKRHHSLRSIKVSCLEFVDEPDAFMSDLAQALQDNRTIRSLSVSAHGNDGITLDPGTITILTASIQTSTLCFLELYGLDELLELRRALQSNVHHQMLSFSLRDDRVVGTRLSGEELFSFSVTQRVMTATSLRQEIAYSMNLTGGGAERVRLFKAGNPNQLQPDDIIDDITAVTVSVDDEFDADYAVQDEGEQVEGFDDGSDVEWCQDDLPLW